MPHPPFHNRHSAHMRDPPAPPCGAVTRLVGWRLVTIPGLYKWAVIFPATIPLPFWCNRQRALYLFFFLYIFLFFYYFFYCIETERHKSIYTDIQRYLFCISGYKNGFFPLVSLFLFLFLCLSLLFCFVFLPWFIFSALDQFL